MATDLPVTPSSPFDSAGRPQLGRFAGPLSTCDLSRRAGRRAVDLVRRKRWVYALVATEEYLCAAAIVDAGYAANAFALAASAERGVLARTSALGLPGLARVGDQPGQGMSARFSSPRLRVRLTRPEGASAYRLQVESRDLSVDAVLDGQTAPAPLVAVADLAPLGGGVNVTEKQALLRSAGVVRAGKETLPLDDALGGLDYTQGILPRRTAWRWAFLLGRAADGTEVGLNLVEGFNGETECGAWIGGELLPLGEGRIQGDAEHPHAPWRVGSACGAVRLRFQPFGLHEERRDLLLVRSRFLQPLGRYSGELALPGRAPLRIDDALGVTEDQDTLW